MGSQAKITWEKQKLLNAKVCAKGAKKGDD